MRKIYKHKHIIKAKHLIAFANGAHNKVGVGFEDETIVLESPCKFPSSVFPLRQNEHFSVNQTNFAMNLGGGNAV